MRDYHALTEEQAAAIRKAWHFEEALRGLETGGARDDLSELLTQLKQAVNRADMLVTDESRQILKEWEEVKERYSQDELCYEVRSCDITRPLTTESLSHQRIPKISLPRFQDPGETLPLDARRKRSGIFSLHSRSFPLETCGRRSHPDVCR